MNHCFQKFIRSLLLAITIFAFSASVQAQIPPISSAPTTPTKNAKPIVEPRKMVDIAAFRAAVSEARTAMDAGDFGAAEKAYAQAIAADPLNPRAHFNHGVAQYKSGNLKAASESFASAAQIGDEGLAAQAMFNQGNAVYADALKQIGADDSGSKGTASDSTTAHASPDRKKAIEGAIEGAIEAVTSALTHFKDAAAADQSDIDARVNAETAARLLKNLEEIKKKQDEQKKDDQKKDQDKQEEKKEDQPKQDQEKPDQKKQDQQKGDQDEPKDEQSKGDQQKKDEKPADAPPDDSKDGKEKPPNQTSEKENSGQAQDKQSAAGEPVKDAPLTKQEAERLLQAVRDREKSRKEAKEQAQPTRRIPASKDW